MTSHPIFTMCGIFVQHLLNSEEIMRIKHLAFLILLAVSIFLWYATFEYRYLFDTKDDKDCWSVVIGFISIIPSGFTIFHICDWFDDNWEDDILPNIKFRRSHGN